MERVNAPNIELDLCPQCEGSWYDIVELDRAFSLTDEELEATPRLASRGAGAVDLEAPVNCPRCGQATERSRYLSHCEVVVDQCPEHGVWLDGGELKALRDSLAQSVETETAAEWVSSNQPGLLQFLKSLFGKR